MRDRYPLLTLCQMMIRPSGEDKNELSAVPGSGAALTEPGVT